MGSLEDETAVSMVGRFQRRRDQQADCVTEQVSASGMVPEHRSRDDCLEA